MATAKAAAADDAAASDSKKLASGKVVKYIGTADIRRISAADWRNAGVDEQLQIEWHRGNKFTVPVDQFTDDAMQYLESDSGFAIVDADTQ